MGQRVGSLTIFIWAGERYRVIFHICRTDQRLAIYLTAWVAAI
ncbi:hypothetical protein [Trichormus azollae]|nr:hypothetical protein [Trichormus azollae]